MEKQPTDNDSGKENTTSDSPEKGSGFHRPLAITFGFLQVVWLAWLGWVAWKVLSG